MLLWEANIAADNEGIEIAVSELSFNLMKRVRRCIHPKLGGVWRTEGPGVVAAWYSKTAQARNRVVHRGYRPLQAEAEASFRAMNDLMEYVCDLLAQKRRRFPRTTLRFLGRDGLDRRNAWSDGIFSDDVIGYVEDYTRDYVAWRDKVDSLIESGNLAE